MYSVNSFIVAVRTSRRIAILFEALYQSRDLFNYGRGHASQLHESEQRSYRAQFMITALSRSMSKDVALPNLRQKSIIR
jgi:hypothetical protein